MKKQPLAYVSPVVTAALQETASRLAGLDLDVITAAVWAFYKQEETIRQHIVADVWLRQLLGSEAPGVNRRHTTFTEQVDALAATCYSALRHWLAQYDPDPARGTAREVLRTQQFVAALYWFATFPLEARLEIVREFGVQLSARD
jgi:hypothetical protein